MSDRTSDRTGVGIILACFMIALLACVILAFIFAAGLGMGEILGLTDPTSGTPISNCDISNDGTTLTFMSGVGLSKIFGC